MQNDPVVDLAYKQTFFAMRDGMMTHLSLIGAQGLVSLPSYHVALSVILMITFRGVKPLFWPIVALNTLVIASTPIDGGHHMVDGFAGAALAVLSSLAVIKFRARYFPAKPHTDATAEPAYTDLAGQKA